MNVNPQPGVTEADSSAKTPYPPGSETLPETVRPAFAALWEQNHTLAARVTALEGQLNQTGKSAITWTWIFHPYVILAASLGVALAFAALIIVYRELSLSGDRYLFFLVYIVPISAPFIAFLLDRAARWREYSAVQFLIDTPVILLSFARTVYSIPLISGHALFLTYALLTIKSRAVQILTALVLIEVIYLKIFAWHDVTLVGGALLGILTAVIVNQYGKKRVSV